MIIQNKQRTTLIIAWILLVVWGAGLLYWWQHQNTRLAPQPGTVAQADEGDRSPQETADQPASAPAGPSSLEPPRPYDEVLLELTPAARPPGPLAATEDFQALAMAFDASAAQAHIATLASPPYDGRRAGTEGGRLASEYIAQQFARYDMQPAGDLQPDGSRSYFQAFGLPSFVAYAEPPVLEIFGPDGQALGPYQFRTDFSSYIRDYAGQGEGEGSVVWANYCSHNDFDHIDAVDAVVLCRPGGDENISRNAIEHGALGMLLIGEPEARPIDRIGRYHEPLVATPLPAFVIDPELVDDLLTDSGVSPADLTIQFRGLQLATTAHLQVKLEQRADASARNVLAIIPGFDEDHAQEVVVIGGHFDHLGQDPDGEHCTRDTLDGAEQCRPTMGTTYWGANDNASGVGTLLEITRLWHEQGFVPRRTVLFAGWDAEEQGLLGSTYYVEHPTLPLTNTVAYLNLDMVGAGSEILAIDGPGPIADRLVALAPTLGISTTLEDGGRSDHTPFRASGVDASMLIWFADYQTDSPELIHYHRPSDEPSTINDEKLRQAGQLASLALINLATTDAELDSLVQQRLAAINERDRDRFLATSTPAQRVADLAWYNELFNQDTKTLGLSLHNPLVVGDAATATLQYQMINPLSNVTQRIDEPVRFRRLAEGWRFDGPALQTIEGSDLVLHLSPQEAHIADQIVAAAQARQAAIAHQLGLGPTTNGDLYIHPTQERLLAAAGLGLPPQAMVWAASGNAHLTAQTEITRTDTLSTALTLLTLSQARLEETQAPWLWHGLPLHLASPSSRQRQPVRYLRALQTMLENAVPFSVKDFPSLRAQEGGTTAWEALAWAMSGYLLETYDRHQVGALITELGQRGDVDEALKASLNLSAEAFDEAWQTVWRDRLIGAQAQVDRLLERRVEAVMTGDRAGFLSTVNPADAELVAEEASWFAAIENLQPPLTSFDLEGNLVGDTPRGAIVELQASWQLEGDSPQRTAFTVWLPRRNDRLFYGGPDWLSLADGRLALLYKSANKELAQALLPQLASTYELLASRLGIDGKPITVKLFNNAQELRLSINPALPKQGTVWTGSRESVRALVEVNDRAAAAKSIHNSLLEALVEQLLLQASVDSTPETQWLRTGLGRVALGWASPQVGWQQAGRFTPRVLKGAQREELWPLSQVPPPSALVSSSDQALAAAQSWDAVRFLINTFGEDKLSALILNLAAGDPPDEAMESAIGLSLANFEAVWLETAKTAHIPPSWQAMAESVDGQAALQLAEALSSPEYGGRETGTAGGQAAAFLIAQEMRTLGLEPAGDGESYLQTFAISQSLPTAEPQLVIQREDETLTFNYRKDFVERIGDGALGGRASGPLVWVRDPGYVNMRLDGKVVLRKPSADLGREIQLAREAGAGALILATSVGRNELEGRSPIVWSESITETLPVIELTEPAFEALLEFGGHSIGELNAAPDALQLGLSVRVSVPLSEPVSATGSNVLALWPGSDPTLADEFVVIGAHYDGPGTDASGILFPGGNDNASGIGVLLEIAERWREHDIAPARSVLFAAWDGEERGQRGSRAYVIMPTVPLSDTAGVVNLDNVGAGQGFFLTYEADRSQAARLNWAIGTASEVLDVRADPKGVQEVSDQTVFAETGIPAALLIWEGADDDANSFQDTPDELDVLKLKRSGQVAALALILLAN
jgi:Zn-dependent M28 family amino/carboxypeptidase